MIPDDGLTLQHFVSKAAAVDSSPTSTRHDNGLNVAAASNRTLPQHHHNKNNNSIHANGSANNSTTYKFHMRTFGCQMNVNDTDIVRSLLLTHTNSHDNNNKSTDQSYVAAASTETTTAAAATAGPMFQETDDPDEADIWLTNTCAIRDNAEERVWTLLHQQRALQRSNPNNNRKEQATKKRRITGVLGCMAERLQDKLLENDIADLVVGPDAYRNLPKLLLELLEPAAPQQSEEDEVVRFEDAASAGVVVDYSRARKKKRKAPKPTAMNVELSLTETYADITPMRPAVVGPDGAENDDVTAFVSIQRGCSNRCSFCIVPFTRGVERSRPMQSVLDEILHLRDRHSIREVTLLGQNVNSYHDTSSSSHSSPYTLSNAGFRSRLNRPATGYWFADLLEAVAAIDPDQLRVRFTSPHPKDYPFHLLQLMADTPNLCNSLHMPAQSGSTTVLARMKRGYTREAYLNLIDDVKATIPDVAISSDFIAGFCDETDTEHTETVALMNAVQYDQAYMFAYSLRDKTHAARKYSDNVPADIKQRRLEEIIETFRRNVQEKNEKQEVGRVRLVLVEGISRKKGVMLTGRTDQNKRILFHPGTCYTESAVRTNDPASAAVIDDLHPGDYVAVLVTEAKGHTLRGTALWKSDGINSFHSMMQQQDSLVQEKVSLVQEWQRHLQQQSDQQAMLMT
jgi:MiaB/RimO family radical SAM methylthiotransferase